MKILRSVIAKLCIILLLGNFSFVVSFFAMSQRESVNQEKKDGLFKKIITQPADFYEEDIKGKFFGEYARQASFGGGVLAAVAGGVSCGLAWLLHSSLHPDTTADMFGWGSVSCLGAGTLLSLYHCVFKNCRSKNNQEKRKANALYRIADALQKTPDCGMVTSVGRQMCNGGDDSDEDEGLRYRQHIDEGDRNNFDDSDEESEDLGEE
jgi:hypothetical protein